MAVTVNGWFPSLVHGDLSDGGRRVFEFSTFLVKNISSRHCQQLYLFDSKNATRSPFGVDHHGREDLGNIDMDFVSSRTGTWTSYGNKTFRYATSGVKTCHCNRQRSSSGTLCAGSKFWGSFTDRGSEVQQSESDSAVPLDVSMTKSVVATNREERATVAGTDELVSSNPLPEKRSNEESSPSTVSPELSRGRVRRFSVDNSSFPNCTQEGKNLSLEESEQMKLLMSFKITNCSSKGILIIRALRVEQLKEVEQLLTDSYAELMWGPFTYRPALAWILRGYLRERHTRLPHAVTLVGLYAPSEENELVSGQRRWFLVGAVEVSFNASGQPNDMLTPVPPKDAPFLSNMAVQKKYRRRGIGRQLLKAAEQLAIEMGSKEMYLHCRMVDDAPLSMYRISGYKIVATDSMFTLLTFQRRRHLMCKRLSGPLMDGESEEKLGKVSQSRGHV